MIDSDSNKKNKISISNRLAKCNSRVVHEVMRDDGFKKFDLIISFDNY